MEKINRKKGVGYREMIRIGNRIIKSPIFNTKRDAKNWKSRQEHLKNQGFLQESNTFLNSKQTFASYAQEWLENKILPFRAKRTFDNYESKLRKHILPHVGSKLLVKIEERDALTLITKLRKNGHRPKGINDIITLLKSIMLQAKKERRIAFYPFEQVPKLHSDLLEDNYWQKSDIQQFLSGNEDSELVPIVKTALMTGMRLGELCGLQWDRVDFNLNLITVSRIRDRVGVRETTKTHTKRRIPMRPELRGLLEYLRSLSPASSYVFLNHQGVPLDYGHIYRDFKQAQIRAGFERTIRFHDLRHTFASLFMSNGGNLFELQKLLGHSNIEMTMRYAHFSPEHLMSSVTYMDMGIEPQKILSEPKLNQKMDFLDHSELDEPAIRC